MMAVPKTMRAAQFKTSSGGLDKTIFVSSIDVPTLPKDSILIKNAFSSLNPVDYKIAESPAGYFFSKPSTPGSDIAGTVVQSNWSKFKVGDRVAGMAKSAPIGALAEYIIHDNDTKIVKLPDSVSLEDGSTIGIAAVTAYQSIQPFVKKGDRVLINGGSGGVGVFAIQVAKILGCTVTAVCSGVNVDLCKSLGADEVLDYKKGLVQQLSGDYDYVLDCIFADPDLYWQVQPYIKKGATFGTIAFSPSMASFKAILGIKMSFRGGPFKVIIAKENKQHYEQIVQWLAQKELRTVIQEVIPLANTAEAFGKMKSGRTKGKIVIKLAE